MITPVDYIYDIETLKRLFTFIAKDAEGNVVCRVECSRRKNEIGIMFDFLDMCHKKKHRHVGFNNLGFDYPVIHDLLSVREKALTVSGSAVATRAYNAAQAIFRSQDRFGTTIKAKDIYVKQVDLYKIHHFDNKARSTSLKALEFNMRRSNVMECPVPFDADELSDEQIEQVLEYNDEDVDATVDFYKASLPMLSFRDEITTKYSRDFTNHNDTKIGKDYFIMRLEEAGIQCFKSGKGGRSPIQTVRDSIDIGSVLFNYYDFKRPEFIAIKDWFAAQRITETKGVFSDIKEHDLGAVAQYCQMETKRQKKNADIAEAFAAEVSPLAWVERVELSAKKKGETQYSTWVHWRCADTLNVVVDGFRFDFGTGGVHGSLESAVVRSDDEYEIVDADVASMYGNVAISNDLFPSHLSDKFCEIYLDVYNQRKSYKKGTAENAMLKLALNGVYGDSNNKYSPFYDPAYTMAITINGQLSLCLLAERLLEIEGLRIVQVNTDGITVRLPRTKRAEYDAVCVKWQLDVRLQLEFAEYSAMYIRDCNNYLAVYTNGKVKRKGAYQYEDLGWHQDQGGLVIPKAAEAFMLHGTPIKNFIMEHEDVHDFMMRVKVPRSSKLMFIKDGVATQQQNICRYYACKDGGKLVKIMPSVADDAEDRNIGIAKEWNVKVCNDMETFGRDIDVRYYVSEALKLVIA
jgi:hypothetical protein